MVPGGPVTPFVPEEPETNIKLLLPILHLNYINK